MCIEKATVKIREILQTSVKKANIIKTTVTEGHDDFTLIALTEDDEYRFIFQLIDKIKAPDFQKNVEYSVINIEDDKFTLVIKHVTVKGYTTPEPQNMDAKQLLPILKMLAFNHSITVKENILQNGESLKQYSLVPNVIHAINVIDNMHNDNFDKKVLKEGIDKLIDQSQENFKTKLYVPGSLLQSKVFIRYSEKKLDYKVVNTEMCVKNVPLEYDVLLTVFYFLDQKLRQDHFHELIHYYYLHLEKYLTNVQLDLSKILTMDTFKNQIHKFLPYVKLAMMSHLSKNDNKANTNLLNIAILELYESVLYPKLSREDCYEIVRNKIESRKYEFESYKLTQLEERPGMLGDYYKLHIKVNYNNKDLSLSFFAKYLPTTNEFVREVALNSFKKEKFVYKTFLEELISLGLKGLTDFLPACYFSRSDDVLIFEDLSLFNYRTIALSAGFDYNCMQVAVRQLVKFHACSLLYEEKMSTKTGKVVRINDVYKQFTEEVDFQIEIEDNRKKRMVCGISSILKYGLEIFPDILNKLTPEEFTQRATKVYYGFLEKIRASDKFRNVLCHGDFWASNILFKMNQNNIPIDCRIVDFQLTRYCPLAEDLLYLFYYNTTRETRRKWMPTIINQYYKLLSDKISEYGCDMNKIYSYENFLEACEYMKSAVICQASLILQFILYPSDKMQKIFSDNAKMEYIFNVDRGEILKELRNPGPYRERIKEILEDLYEICENEYNND